MINGQDFKFAIISGANNLYKNKNFVNELNIFPVPDGDTGSNMSMTMEPAVKELENEESKYINEISELVSSKLLIGARGNSGVILSLIFQGFSKILKNMDVASGEDFVDSLELGSNLAYKNVMNPTEGTILTVVRMAFERGKLALKTSNDLIYIFSQICIGAEEALKLTPELLPVLKRANVVDSGGKGLCLILEGMLHYFKNGKIIEKEITNLNLEIDDKFKNDVSRFDGDIRFTYCTEFIVKKNKLTKINVEKMRKKLERIGDCVVVVTDEIIIKTHVHTENPDKALKEGLEFGELMNIKIENMKEQRRVIWESQSKNKIEIGKLEFAEPIEEVGFVAVACGNGLVDLFKNLGCSNVVTGGQTMNPSTNQILGAVLATPSKIVYVFPNNRNIIMAAEQTVNLAKDRVVVIIPTKTIPQGISAILKYNFENSMEDNIKIMTENLSKVQTGQITFAARNSEFGGLKIKKDNILALKDGKLVFVMKDIIKTLFKLLKLLVKKDSEFLTIIKGENVTQEQSDKISNILKSKYKNLDVNIIQGDQPVYYFIVAVE
ncbi:MAG: DAK2 domain-containing protein [Candidatus Paraimprobicoccus trichonymphae]|uniref:DAK2 domain-containing protein n=1 Tax=Candidatus Paraimprobicoccus trichonymphae TaxID=3033793 RepID=A0AA48KWD7_9FIRM|nr:MAG: DAK2 domain-containing protein [Candidatus Paraimprobicoccus trichonymphae]